MKSHALKNPEELLRVIEDHIITTTKLTASPYALPFAKRVAALRSQQDLFLNFLFVWIEMQRIWLELRPLYDQSKLRTVNQGECEETYVKCDKSIRKLLKHWYEHPKDEDHQYYAPSPNTMLQTPRVLQRVEMLNKTLQQIKIDVLTHVRDDYYSTAPRTRYLDMKQCLRLNALEYYPDELDHVVTQLFPGARRWLIEPESALNGME